MHDKAWSVLSSSCSSLTILASYAAIVFFKFPELDVFCLSLKQFCTNPPWSAIRWMYPSSPLISISGTSVQDLHASSGLILLRSFDPVKNSPQVASSYTTTRL
mmetsp:Transcript_16982/g.23768  ORF Transcript_16982/g.23768 Transcript_16982/m.23768 type:complete len:103 (+) Transcript_16982:111-419(+)